jgi:uncharacterized protein YdeI (YjbR/CyaY-like superfamily)
MDDLLMFANRLEFRQWLTDNAVTSPGKWMVFSKGRETKTIKPDEALKEALCFGWIDGRIKSIDDRTYAKMFSRRNKNSRWSERNRELAEELIKEGLMT